MYAVPVAVDIEVFIRDWYGAYSGLGWLGLSPR